MAKSKEISVVPRPGGLEAVYFEDGTREVRKVSKRRAGRSAKVDDDTDASTGEAGEGDNTEA